MNLRIFAALQLPYFKSPLGSYVWDARALYNCSNDYVNCNRREVATTAEKCVYEWNDASFYCKNDLKQIHTYKQVDWKKYSDIHSALDFCHV